MTEIREGYCQGWAGPARDDIVFNAPWGFRLEEISVRVDLWHGEADRNVSVSHAEYMDERLPCSRLTGLTGQGHLQLLA